MNRITTWILAILLLAPAVHAQQRVPVPARVQLELLSKILSLDRNFQIPRRLTVAVVYQRLYRESFVIKEEIVEAARRLDALRLRLIEADETLGETTRFDDVDVVYVAPLRAVDLQKILAETRRRQIRSMTGVPEYAQEGVAVGFGVERDRAVIIVNLQAARDEGADFSSQLLKLARVIR